MLDVIQRGAAKVGGLGKLASALGVRHQTFYSWNRVPAERVLDMERVTGISRFELRPDIYGAGSDNSLPASQPEGMVA